MENNMRLAALYITINSAHYQLRHASVFGVHGWIIGMLVSFLFGWLGGCVAAWLVGWQAGRLVG